MDDLRLSDVLYSFEITPPVPYEQEVVNTSFQVEKLFNYPRAWERWFINAIDGYRSIFPVRPDLSAIRAACDVVGLRNIPQMFYNTDFGNGTTFRIPSSPAIISFDYYLTVKAASVILWHELRHAAVHEQTGYFMPTEPMPDYRLYPERYWYDPEEVDARSFESYGLDFPLVVEEDASYTPDRLNLNWS